MTKPINTSVKLTNKVQYTGLHRYPLKGVDVLSGLLLILIGCLLATCVVRYRLIFLVNSDIGGIESNVIYAVQRYMAGYPLYGNPEVAPYTITQYSPLYYRTLAALGFIVGIDPDDPLSIYRLSRTVSLAINGVYVLLLFGFCRQLHLRTKVSLCVAIAAFVLLPPQSYSRPDSLYSMLVIAALYTGLRAIRTEQLNNERAWLVATVGLAALAIAAKQSGIVLFIILGGYYGLCRGQWLKAVLISAGIGAAAWGLLLGFMPEHNLTLLYANLVKGVNQGFDWNSFKINILDHYFRTFSLHNALGLPLSIWLIRQTRSDYRWLGWSVLSLFGFALATSLKWGAALNYFTEYVALVGVAVAIWVQQQGVILAVWNRTWSLLGLSTVVWAVAANMMNFDWARAMQSNVFSTDVYRQQKLVAGYVTDSLKLQPSESVLITDYNYSYLNGLLYRNCLVPQQDIVGVVMYPQKKLNYTALDAQIRQRGIRFLITRTNETITSFPGLTTSLYKLRRRFPEYDVYEMK